MRQSLSVMCLLSFCFLTLVQGSIAASNGPQCQYPAGLSDKISELYPGRSLVRLNDLSDYDRKLFQKSHGKRCPGLVRVNFYGDGKPTWAILLIAGEGPKRKAELIVARRLGKEWDIRLLDDADATSVPVIWSQGPGKYDDVSNPKMIRAKNPVIVFCGYESWAIVYAWTGQGVEKVWISD